MAVSMNNLRKRLFRHPLIRIMKLRMVVMVSITTALGFVLASHQIDWFVLTVALLGSALTAAGSMVLNQYLEHPLDSQMNRTKLRPIPNGELSPSAALFFGSALVLIGVFALASWVNLLSAFLTMLIAFLYVVVYTPLKQMSWINTPIGAVSGALPPVVGWAAASSQLSLEAWILFAILFIWQHPHFYSIAWLYREDYGRAGFKMLSNVDPTGSRVIRQSLFFSLVLIPASVWLHYRGLGGEIYLIGAWVLGVLFLLSVLVMARDLTQRSARLVLKSSLLYVPLLMLLLAIDHQSL